MNTLRVFNKVTRETANLRFKEYLDVSQLIQILMDARDIEMSIVWEDGTFEEV